MDVRFWIVETVKAFSEAWDDYPYTVYHRWLEILEAQENEFSPDTTFSKLLMWGAKVVCWILCAIILFAFFEIGLIAGRLTP